MFEFVIRNQGFPTITIYAQEVTDKAASHRHPTANGFVSLLVGVNRRIRFLAKYVGVAMCNGKTHTYYYGNTGNK